MARLVYFLLVASLLQKSQSDKNCPLPCQCARDTNNRLTVTCRDQALTSLPDFTTLVGTHIHHLYLDMNQLTSIPEHAFKNLWISALDLSFNPITNISPSALDGLQEGLEYLVLKQTRLLTRPVGFLQGMDRLQVLDLSDITSGLFLNITADTFPDLPSLEDLLLDHCIVNHISENAFDGMDSLVYLSLEENTLTSIPAAINEITGLNKLNIAQNKIKVLSDTAFNGLQNLRSLDLGSNEGLVIDADVFQPCRESLQELILAWTDLKTVPSYAFGNLKNLRVLDLSGNIIDTIEENAFIELTNLEDLDLSINYRLEILGQESLNGIKQSLKTLKMNQVSMSTIPTAALESLANLETLDLSFNSLTDVPNFSGVHATNLNFHMNQIQRVSPDAFHGKSKRISLDLSFNKIMYTDFVSDPCQFWKINLEMNPSLNCSCSLLAAVSNFDVLVTATCAFPESLSQKNLQEAEVLSYLTSSCNNTAEHVPKRYCDWTWDTATASTLTATYFDHLILFVSFACIIL